MPFCGQCGSPVGAGNFCDKCGARSDEYSSWPTCTHCDGHICPSCMVAGSKTDADLDTPETCMCIECDHEVASDEFLRDWDDDDGVQYADPRDEMEDRIWRD